MTNNNIDFKSLTENVAKALAGTIERFLAAQGIELKHTASLDLVGQLTGNADWRSLKAYLKHAEAQKSGVPQRLGLAEFETRFKPMKNTLVEGAAFDGCAFEAHGPELAFVQTVRETHPDRVWTVVDGDVSSWLTSGYHYVNRVFYLVTHVECPIGEFYEIPYGHDETDKLFEVSVLDNKGTDIAFKERVYAADASEARERLTCDIDNEASQILEAGGAVYVIVEQVNE